MRRIVLAVALLGLQAMPAAAKPPDTHEVAGDRPSGFWTSTGRASVARRYRLLLIGVASRSAPAW
jgi:hypothetical protein